MPIKAVILLSGGLDSATVSAIAKSKGYQLYGLSLSYGQSHEIELKAAKKIAKRLGFQEHQILKLPFGQWGGSALLKQDSQKIPLNRSDEEIAQGIAPTYVPARNTIFLSLALSWAEVLKADAIFLGVNAIDYSGYPDCRPDFLQAFQNLIQVATKESIEGKWQPKIEAPLLHLTKAQIINKGIALGINYSLTHSCYNPNSKGVACGQCDSCRLRLKGFHEAGLKDAIKYQNGLS